MAEAQDGKEKYTFFWKSRSPFSQWHPSYFTIDDVEYSCAEQYMMHQKAVIFEDEESAAEILATDNPKTMKGIGRTVKNFDMDIWTATCQDVVKRGSMAKFSQNEDLRKALFKTAGTVLVEASPHDHIWGIGMNDENPKAYKKATWKGQNLLGYILTDVRDTLMAEMGDTQQNVEEEKYTFFWRAKSPFSQHHPSHFTIDGVEYSCAEQYMMHQKAVTFDDKESAEEILAADDPKIMKACGRKVQNFNMDKWMTVCKDIVKRGSMAKYSQNAHLKKALFQTAGTVLVEASPHDNIWGIGLEENDPKARNRSTWEGKNFLGDILTEVRDTLMAQDAEMKT